MSTGSALVAVVAVAVATYLMRAGLIVMLAGVTVPAAIERGLRYVGPATLAALTANLAVGGDDGLHVEAAEAAALAIAAVVTVWRRQLVLPMIAGLVTLWVVGALG